MAAEQAEQIVIVGYARTPFGKFFGALREHDAHALAAVCIDALLARLPGTAVVEALYLGVGMPGGVFTPARQTVLTSGLPDATPSFAVDRACCSGLTAIGLAQQALAAGDAGLVLAGGAESLSRTPLLARRVRRTRPGDDSARDRDAPVYDPLLLKSPLAGKAIADYTGEEALAAGVGREAQDAWAARSHARWFAADAEGYFAPELVPVAGLAADESPRATDVAALAPLPTIYNSPTITAGNAPGLSDGAAMLLLASATRAAELGLPVLATLGAHAVVADGPTSGSWTPALAIERVLATAGLAAGQLELLEINEAYAATPLVSTLRLAGGDHALLERLRGRTNVHGGAVALGHPLGASGARIVMTLVNGLARRGGGRGVAAICGGYGQGEALLVEVT